MPGFLYRSIGLEIFDDADKDEATVNNIVVTRQRRRELFSIADSIVSSLKEAGVKDEVELFYIGKFLAFLWTKEGADA